MRYILENWDAISYGILALHGVAVAVVNITPTPKDDQLLGKAYKIVETVAGLITRKAKMPPKK